jgi:hypothetical protein
VASCHGYVPFDRWILHTLHSADTNTCGEHLPVEVIVEKLQAANLCRAEALSGYTGKRGYKVDYRGLSWMLLAGTWGSQSSGFHFFNAFMSSLS